ncbi:hypothetical protein D3C87_1618400 [compost metagenome]
MHGKGKYLRLVVKNLCRSIALVYIQVNDQDTPGQFIFQQMVCRNGLVIQQAKALSPIAAGMVCAPRNIKCNAILLCI